MIEISVLRAYVHDVLRPEQCRAARGLLGWNQKKLATEANLKEQALRRFELGHSDPRASTRDRIERTLISAGIDLIEGEGWIGVRLRSPYPQDEKNAEPKP